MVTRKGRRILKAKRYERINPWKESCLLFPGTDIDEPLKTEIDPPPETFNCRCTGPIVNASCITVGSDVSSITVGTNAPDIVDIKEQGYKSSPPIRPSIIYSNKINRFLKEHPEYNGITEKTIKQYAVYQQWEFRIAWNELKKAMQEASDPIVTPLFKFIHSFFDNMNELWRYIWGK
jgi:hypothetical protein